MKESESQDHRAEIRQKLETTFKALGKAFQKMAESVAQTQRALEDFVALPEKVQQDNKT